MLASVYSKSGRMKFEIYFVTVFGIFGMVSSIPDCPKSNKTCPLDTKHFSLAPVSLTTWGKCRTSAMPWKTALRSRFLTAGEFP